MSISDYVIKFEQFYFKAKPFHMEILDGILAYSFLNSANLTNEQKQLQKQRLVKWISKLRNPVKRGLYQYFN